MIKMEDLPFGPPPENYSYRCSHCKHEYTVNEVIVDAAIGWAEFDGDYEKGFMPILGCPNCNQETLEYVKD
jgi:hypothetical protein